MYSVSLPASIGRGVRPKLYAKIFVEFRCFAGNKFCMQTLVIHILVWKLIEYIY